MDHGAEFWQNMVHWKREWKTTSEFFFSPVATAEFSKFAGILAEASLGFEIAQLEFHHLH